VLDGFTQWSTNRYGHAMLTRAIEVRIGRTATGDWNAIIDGDGVFVFGWVGVTLVSDEYVRSMDGDIEGLVLSALCDSVGEFELC